MSETETKRRTPWLWGFAGWVLALGVIGLWRGVILWQERTLLIELESGFPPVWLATVAGASALFGMGLGISAVGLWLRQDWARTSTRIGIPLHACTFQVYSWFFVQSGLMAERRWVALLSSVAAILVGTAALTWKKARTWIGLG